MLSKEEVADVISYCKEHGCSYKERLAELGIPEWKFYDSKYKYAIRERKEFDVLTKKHDYGYKDHVKASTALTYLVYNIFRYERLC